MQNVIKTDIAIIGAGPTGLALACQLIRHGIDFVIIDKKETTTAFSKAIGVQARTLEIYEQMGLAQKLIELGRPASHIRIFEGGEAQAEVDLSELGAGLSPYPYMLVVDQGKHEEVLYQFIRSMGKDVRWQTSLAKFSQDKNGVTADIVDDVTGKSTRLEAKYLVACDGAKSPVRHGLGITFEGSTFERLFYVADVQVNWPYPHGMLTGFVAKDRSTAFFPMLGDDRYRVVGVFPDIDREEGTVPFDEIERQIKEDTQLEMDIYQVNWFSTYKVHSRRVNKFSEGRCFLVGDAAHIHSPAGGQGMNTGIQDGYNLAWKLAAVIKGEAGADLLATYNEERIEVATRLLETTDRMFDLLMNPHWLLAFVRTQIFPRVANFVVGLDSVKRFFFPLISQIGISYRDRSLSAEGSGSLEVEAGDRMPYFMLDGKSIYDGLRQPMFHLLTFTDEPAAARNKHGELAEEYGGVIDFSALPLFPRVSEVFGTDEPFSILLRPDNYLAFIGAEDCTEQLDEYFASVIGRERHLGQLAYFN